MKKQITFRFDTEWLWRYAGWKPLKISFSLQTSNKLQSFYPINYISYWILRISFQNYVARI